MSDSNQIKCKECGAEVSDYLGDHLVESHKMTGSEYLTKHPGAPTMSKRLADRAAKKQQRRREPPPDPAKLTVEIGGVTFPVNANVPAEVCLPLPKAYRFPSHGQLAQDIRHTAISVRKQRHGYVHGLPGTGKDAFLHAVSALARIPAMIRSIKPGVNIQHWFYSRSFNKDGTEWERGPLLDALVNGYPTVDASGNPVRIPYLIAITDFDRADRAQAEHLRLIMDTTAGRVEGPQGKTEDVLPGTMIWATGNSAGSGDTRGRCISSNVIDASIMDRFDRVYEFHWMSWKDEEPICKEKFPLLVERCPWLFDQIGKCTASLRKAILNQKIYAEFSHRAVCTILEHAQDLVEINKGKDVPKDIIVGAARAWLDRLGDPVTKEAAIKSMDAHVPGGMLDNGGGPDIDSDFDF